MRKRLFILSIIVLCCFLIPVEAAGKTGFFVENNATYYYENGIIQMGITEIAGEEYFLGEYTGKVQVGFVTSSLTGDTYYTDSTGKIQKGFVSIEGSTYYFDSEGKLQYGITKIDGEEYFLGEYTGKVQVGFVTSSLTGDTYYTDSTGKIQKGFVSIEGSTYYFDSEGKLQYGITEIDGEEYFLGEYTGKVQVGFVTSSLTGDRYYTDKDGKIQKGITNVEGEDYFFGEYTGKVQVGFVQSSITSKYYITDENGKIYKDSFEYEGCTYYTKEDGSLIDGFYEKEGEKYYYILGILQYGITKIDGEEYFLGEYTGKVQVGFVTSSLTGDRYYTDKDGKIQKGITNVEGEDYFFGEYTGKVQVGFVQSSITSKYYITDENGKIYKDSFEYEGCTYYTKEDGSLIDGFYEKEGEKYYYILGILQYGITKIDGEEYFLGEYTGKVQVGFVTSSLTGDRYYTDKDGKIQKGITDIEGQRYFLGELTGKIQSGWVTSLEGKIYYTNEEGVIQTGIQTIDGRVYKFDENGVIETGFQTINGNTYYYNYDGSMVTGVQKIHGIWYRFNPDGVLREQEFKRIVDISYHQGEIDWDTLWNSGEIDGVILRIGYNGYEDIRFKEYLDNVKRLNIPYGIYLYSYAHNPAEAIFEANATVQLLQKYNVDPDYPVYYDIESYDIPSQGESSDDISQTDYEGMVYNYVNRLQAAGYETKVYTYLNYAMTRFNANTRNMVDWIAHYTNGDCGYELPHRGWQYTSSGQLPGISTSVDLNIFYY